MFRRLTAALLLATGFATQALAADPVVTTGSGRVAGVRDGRIERFLGIPFAAPPVGDLRWRAPQPAARWSGVRPAKAFGSDCMQEPYPSDAAPLGTKPAEDCLTVNVWRPAQRAARLPVLVWIYGGGSVNGGASPAVYSGDAFARDGVVMVSFNWRLGRFGFFGHPALTAAGASGQDGGLLANYGFMDSIAALRWVRDNIAAFGGDPGQVTIYGQSAGATQVAMLLGSPLARGLFHRAIIQSGNNATEPRPRAGGRGVASSEATGVAFARRWGIEGDGPEALARLRALTPEQVVDGLRLESPNPATFTGPVADGRLLVGALMTRIAAGAQAPVPLIIGATTADNFTGVTAKTEADALATTFRFAPDAVRAAYAGITPEARRLREMGRDVSYNEPARTMGDHYHRQGLKLWRYRFGYVAKAMRGDWQEGPPHATDIPYAMDTVKAKYGDALAPEDAAMAATVHAYWVNFVKTGDPNGAGLPQWPAHDPQAQPILLFNPDGTVASGEDPYKARIDAVAAARRR